VRACVCVRAPASDDFRTSSGPFSLLMYTSAPRIAVSSSRSAMKLASRNVLSTSMARHSPVYSSSTTSIFRLLPPTVVSWMKSRPRSLSSPCSARCRHLKCRFTRVSSAFAARAVPRPASAASSGTCPRAIPLRAACPGCVSCLGADLLAQGSASAPRAVPCRGLEVKTGAECSGAGR
jgi:hypothetical protein